MGVGVELTEEAGDVGGFEVDAFDLVVGATAFNRGPVDDGCASGHRVAHVRLLEDLFEAGAGTAVSEELIGGEICVAGVIDDVEQT